MAPSFAAAESMAARCGPAPVLKAFAGRPRVLLACRPQLRTQRARQVTRMAVRAHPLKETAGRGRLPDDLPSV